MSYTLLLDLDDTLLQNDIDVFLRHYLGAWGKVMAPYMDPEQFVRVLLGATKAMTANRNPGCTLKSFDAAFFPKLGMNEAQFRALADRFYRDVFPGLGQYTAPVPEARLLIETAQQRGYPIAIATNPLFPAEAIRQRLAWANLPVDEFHFDLVASYETLHFAKPDPAFFAEVLARLGWPDRSAVIVGDDLENEVGAGRKLGLPVYWLPKDGLTPPAEAAGPTARGPLSGLLPWLDRTTPEALAPAFDTPTALIAILRSTLAAFDSFLRSLPFEVWTQRPATDAWSMTEILCHMRDVEAEVNLPRLRSVLAEANPFIPGKDTDAWAEQRDYARQDGRQAWRAFFSARMEMLDVLVGLDEAAWQRPARHAIFGPTRLLEIVSIQSAHDRAHVRQILELGG